MVCGFWFASKHALKSHKYEQLNRQTALIYTRLCNFICLVWNHSSKKVWFRTIQNYRTVYLHTDKIRPYLVLCSRQPRLFEHIHGISLITYSVGFHKLLLSDIFNNVPSDWILIHYWARFLLHFLWYKSLLKSVAILWLYIICKKGPYLSPIKTKSSSNWQSRKKKTRKAF